MSGRDLAPHKIHHARHYLDDSKQRATVHAFGAIARGEFKRDRIDTTAPEGETWTVNETAVVRAALERSRLVPLALEASCTACGAKAGEFCGVAATGVCGARYALARRRRVGEVVG